MISLFFKAVRAIVGPMVLLWERLSSPAPVARPPEAQARIDAETGGLALYQFKTCPFCVIVRREIRRLALKIELRDAQAPGPFRQELLEQGGMAQVPCLRIAEDGQPVRWLYESSEINRYLAERFSVSG